MRTIEARHLLSTTAGYPIPGKAGTIPREQQPAKPRLVDYYEIAGPDYEAWSKSFNMHFGYYKNWTNPFNREQMLDQMNQEVLDRLHLPGYRTTHVLDMGCGLGATSRYIATHHPHAHLTGITIVPWQVKQAKRLNQTQWMADQVEVIYGDYTKIPVPNNSADGCYGMESICYAQGPSKADAINEMYRVLRPGCRMVITDGFRRHSNPMTGLTKKAYDALLDGWALTDFAEINAMKQAMIDAGFTDITIEDISWRVAPSVAHVPFVTLRFLIKELFNSKRKMTKERWDNIKAPMLGMLIGLSQKHFGYFIVAAKKG